MNDFDTVRQDGCALERFHNQTPELCKVAIKQNPYALRYVRIQPLELSYSEWMDLQRFGAQIRIVYSSRGELSI